MNNQASKPTSAPASAYEMNDKHEAVNRHILTVMVDNEPGVLARVVGLFSGRGYNIESLTVTAIGDNDTLSRITIVTQGTKRVINQIKTQLQRLVPVHDVHDLTTESTNVEKEIILLKLQASGEERIEALRMADIFGAKVADTTRQTYVFQLDGSPDKCDAFIKLMRELGVIELVRSGIVAIARGDTLI